MWDQPERREAARLAVDSPAIVFWEDSRGTWCARGRTVRLSESGMSLRLRAGVKPGQILWCGVPSSGIYSRALVVHVRGSFSKIVGLRFLGRAFPDE